MRKSGLLLPISALPSKYGVGDFGDVSKRVINIIANMGIKIWQILPLNPLGFGNSPYQPYSSKAIDEIYVDLEDLKDKGLIKTTDDINLDNCKVYYDYARQYKRIKLKEAFDNFEKNEDYLLFANEKWVKEYALFISLKIKNNLSPWTEWPEKQKLINKEFKIDKQLNENIEFEIFIQYVLFIQFKKLIDYAHQKNIEIMGDIPFYVGLDSSDVLFNTDNFLLDDEYYPTYIAGVPPDYFSETGQRWGNPIYNWDYLAKHEFLFWVDRLKFSSELYDIIRIDHFRAFDTYWKIPVECPNAKNGEWITGPSYDFFDELYRQLPNVKIVVEDLGDLRKQVLKLRDSYSLLGMNVLQFELIPKLLKKPRKENVILYTGTHDNDTIKGYYQDLPQNKKIALRRFFHNCGYDNRDFNELVIRYCLDSNAKVVIIPVQDVLGLGKEGRLNTPSTIGESNWKWKLKNLNRFYELLPQLGAWIRDSNRAGE